MAGTLGLASSMMAPASGSLAGFEAGKEMTLNKETAPGRPWLLALACLPDATVHGNPHFGRGIHMALWPQAGDCGDGGWGGACSGPCAGSFVLL